MLVSVVCDGVGVRVHVYRTQVVGVVREPALLPGCPLAPLEALDPGQGVGPAGGGGGAHADHGAGWTGRTCRAGRTG